MSKSRGGNKNRSASAARNREMKEFLEQKLAVGGGGGGGGGSTK